MGVPGKATVTKAGYKKYIQSKEWQAVRKRFWESKLPKNCFVCGELDGKMDLHHRTYKNLGNERLMDLVPVHRNCHFEIHDLHRSRNDSRNNLWRATKQTQTKNKKRRSKGVF